MDKKAALIVIPEHLLNENEYSSISFAVYGIIKYLMNTSGNQKQCIDEYQILYLLTGKTDVKKHTIENIKKSIEELIFKNEIQKLDYWKKHYILDCSNLWSDTKNEKFTIIGFNELQSVFKINNVNNFSLFKYYVFLISTLINKVTVFNNVDSKDNVVGYFTIDKLSELSGISVRSIMEYNKLLEESNLIYIHRQKDFILDETQNIKRLPNVYGRYSDKIYIDNFAETQRIDNQSYIHTRKTVGQANDNRRLAQMYQQILKGNGNRYSENEISDIYNYVIAQNKKYECLYDKHKDECFLDKIRDTDVFIQFKIIQQKTENI